jgi:hypothetical protein
VPLRGRGTALTARVMRVFVIHRMPGEVSRLDTGSRDALLLEGFTGGMLIVIMLPAIMALGSEKIRIKAAKAGEKVSFLLPSTGEERRWWSLVCLAAGKL